MKESAIIFTPLAAALLVLRPGSPKEKWQAIVPIGVVTVAVVAVGFRVHAKAVVTSFNP